MKTRIEVSPEMEAFVGAGPMPVGDRLQDAIVFGFRLSDDAFAYSPAPIADDDAADFDIVFFVTVEGCLRVFGGRPDDEAMWHLPSDMRAIALAILDSRSDCTASMTLRMAKSIELLCVAFEKFSDQSLIPADGAGDLSATKAQRIAAARRLIDERWNEKLTLDSIARSCGINRVKLTRGFRSMFDMSVADAILERRLGGARELLLVTDLPVSSIGYRCGYLNNASFSRAFSRRFGQTPSHFRTGRLAA